MPPKLLITSSQIHIQAIPNYYAHMYESSRSPSCSVIHLIVIPMVSNQAPSESPLVFIARWLMQY